MNVRKKPTQARSREKVERVLQVAATLLVEQGIDALTTVRIAKTSGVTVGSIYQYFPNKESILHELYQRWLDNALATYTEFAQQHQHIENSADYFADLFSHYMQDVSNEQHQLSIELTNALHVNKQLQQMDKEHENRLLKLLTSDAIRLGLVPPKSQMRKTHKTQLAFIGNLILTLMDMISRSDPKQRTAFVDYAAQTITAAINQLTTKTVQ